MYSRVLTDRDGAHFMRTPVSVTAQRWSYDTVNRIDRRKYCRAMLQFVLADEQAQAFAANRPTGLGRLRGVAVALSSDLLKSGWTEAMRVGDRTHDSVPPPVTTGTPLWKGSARMSLKDARVASHTDARGLDDSMAGSLGGEDMPVSGKLEIFDDHLVMNVPDSGPIDSFAMHPRGSVSVVGVVDGNPGDATFVVPLPNGRRVAVRLGRARGLADVLGTLPPASQAGTAVEGDGRPPGDSRWWASPLTDLAIGEPARQARIAT